MLSKLLLSATLIAVSTLAFADSGTPAEQAACRPDVRRFCHTVKAQDGDMAFLKCLELHRDELSVACRNVLIDHGR
jgi:Cysteine rich repeat